VDRPSEISTKTDLKLETFWRVQKSQLVRNLLSTASFFALSDLGIRIVGEEGSGKLQLARLIHSYSSRGGSSFTHVDCSAFGTADPDDALFGTEEHDGVASRITPGHLETMDEGTVYLDMISALPASTQARLIRTLEQRRFRRNGGNQDVHLNVRIITGRTLPGGARNSQAEPGADLPAAVSPVCINIPPLRERREDIEPLIFLFLQENAMKNQHSVTQITSEALELCRYYSWPGNIYELNNVINHSALRCQGDVLEAFQMPEYLYHEDILKRSRSGAVNAGIQH